MIFSHRLALLEDIVHSIDKLDVNNPITHKLSFPLPVKYY